MRPNCVTGSSPRNCSFTVAARLYRFFQSTYTDCGTPYRSIHRRNASATAQIVSCSPSCAHVVLVAPSTMSIKQPRGPRSSSQAWKLPSSCTLSPECSLRSRRRRCRRRFRSRLHNPSANIQRRTVSACISVRPRIPSARPPASDQSARPPLLRTFPVLAAAPSVATSPRGRDSSCAPRCGAAVLPPLPPDTASTAASPVGSSRAAAALHPPPSVVCSALDPALLLVPLPLAHLCPPQSDLLSEIVLGDISIEDKRGHYHRGITFPGYFP